MKIISPCNENFSKMPLKENGRYCYACEKTVVDFTSMSREELMAYFKGREHEKICGRVKSVQIGGKNAFERALFNFRKFTGGINFTPLRLALLALISGLMTFTTSCMGAMAPAERTAGMDQDSIKDQPKQNDFKKK